MRRRREVRHKLIGQTAFIHKQNVSGVNVPKLTQILR